MPVLTFPRFDLGRTVATPGAYYLFFDMYGEEQAELKMCDLMRRHHTGDWGEMDPDDLQANEQALIDGTRVFSAYNLPKGERVWIITEADRSSTTVLLPEEY
ncbi:MAG: hypothetical protein V4671_19515 [Armatimonadota bacterium]